MKLLVGDKVVDSNSESFDLVLSTAVTIKTNIVEVIALGKSLLNQKDLVITRSGKIIMAQGEIVDGRSIEMIFCRSMGACGNLDIGDTLSDQLCEIIASDFIKKQCTDYHPSYPVGDANEYYESRRNDTMWDNPNRWAYLEHFIERLEHYLVLLESED